MVRHAKTCGPAGGSQSRIRHRDGSHGRDVATLLEAKIHPKDPAEQAAPNACRVKLATERRFAEGTARAR